ncbi:MAG: 4-alpha-glucanotransferase [Oscillospiraceae bacterium]|nr:4-alpha-glucanotransferase [Oscillospiraceae bacterium]
MNISPQPPLTRGAGVLLPISSLPSLYGIGTFGREAFDFIGFLKAAGQKYWQILPLSPTGFGDSPYQSFSAFAGNPYFIDLEVLVSQGLLSRSECAAVRFGDNPERVDYGALWENRYNLLRQAFARSGYKDSPQDKQFTEEQEWLFDFSLFMALKSRFNYVSWLNWPAELRVRESSVLAKAEKDLAEEMAFWRFCQFYFFIQWRELKTYANNNGIQIIGDIPLYVSADSADLWTNPGLFQLDDNLKPTRVAGVPPDTFSETGQLWGNPLYNWEAMEKDGFVWWKRRMAASAALYDIIRIDHFIGIVNYYSIPAADKSAENGIWINSPGKKLLTAVSEDISGIRIIAEDLGEVNKRVTALRKRFGYPGMRLLQTNYKSAIVKNCVVYGGTHDNETLAGIFKKQPGLPELLIKKGYASRADLVVFQMQDYLGLGNESRTNTPSTVGGNWQWRLTKNQLTDELAEKLKRLAEMNKR